MKALLVFGVVLICLFALAYFTKRRFGVLGLALCAGSLLSTSWASSLTPILEQQGLVIVAPPLSSLVSAILVLLPAVLLLFSGPTYTNTVPRIFGAALFALFAFIFLLNPLGMALILDPFSNQIYSVLLQFEDALIVSGIIFALIDILLTRTPRGKKH